MTVNVARLRQAMEDNSVSVDGLARALNIDKTTVYRKMKTNGESFTVGEMHKIVDVLNLTASTASDIFLFENSQ